MKHFSLKTGDQFRKTASNNIYIFEGITISIVTNKAEVVYSNQEGESFNLDMSEFFGHNNFYKKNFVPIKSGDLN